MISALVGHLVADYLLQNDWQAQGKKRSSWICGFHCGIWTLCVWGFTQFPGDSTPWPLWTIPILFITHFAQDRGTLINRYMKMMGQSDFAKPPMSPWSIIVVDNVFHVLTLWILWLFIR